ncbi:DUF4307 domain-containing protein [Nocardioides iriomotensis]|uniref:DUF4307 domain-containing protein n=1 Tax=Nocardioides iriomotensis TaxID=715784 RepID=A0A4Q5J6E6_9ACTN|nr:DUF4307 domain-containing protein [Nocardioides iriomotensis]RYU14230.1 DUF4307 domain-containing protein [Nocardioides iriomotensis]
MTDLAERYGSPSATRRRVVVAVVVVLAGAALAWLGWVILVQGRPLVQSDLVGFEPVDEHAVSATFTVVRRDEDVAASCLLRAVAADHAIVGELDVAVGPGGRATETLERTVRTERAATSVDVVGCTADGQPRRR